MYILSILLFISLIFSLIITITYFQERSKRNQEKSLRDKLDAQLLNYSRLTDQLAHERNLLSDELGTLRSRMEVLLMEIADEKDKLAFREQEYKDKIIPEAINKSRSVNAGLAIEQLAPILSEYNPKDMAFLGNPIDYLVLDGLEDMRNGKINELRKIVLLEIKSGSSQLNAIQRKIKKKLPTVEFKVMRIKEE